MENSNQMPGGSAVEMNNESSNFSANDASYNASGTINASENFTSSSNNYANGGATYGGANNNQSNYTATSTTHANGGHKHESVGCFPGGSIKREVKNVAKELFGMKRHKNGCQHSTTTSTTSTCACTDQATCPHRTQNGSYTTGENCDCNESDTYNSTTLLSNQEAGLHESSNGFNGIATGNYDANNKFSGTETFSSHATGGFSQGESNSIGGERFSNGGPVSGNSY
jgi:hypothetical protein